MSASDTAVRPRAPGRWLAGGGQGVRRSLERAAPALALYAATRLVGLACLTAWAWRLGKHPQTLLGYSWDSMWYLGIAGHGYGGAFDKPHGSLPSFDALAFFPLFPALVRAVTTITPLGAIPAGLLVAWLASGVAAWGIHAIGERLYGRRTAMAWVVLWGLLPHAVVQSMAYTESLLVALASWSLYALLTGRLLWAGALAGLAGLARPNGIAVAAAVWVCAAAALWHGGPTRTGPARTDWRLWTAVLLAPLGWVGYLGWVGLRRGEPLGYFDVQRDWGSRFDFGLDILLFVRDLVVGRNVLAQYMALALVATAVIALVLLVLDRPPPVLLVYTVVLVVIALGGTNFFASRPRFLLPAFPLLLPAAVTMARARARTVAVAIVALAALSWFYGAYLLAMAPKPV